VRIHVKGLSPERVDEQLERHGDGFIQRLQDRLSP
jgi:hypothetical protein